MSHNYSVRRTIIIPTSTDATLDIIVGNTIDVGFVEPVIDLIAITDVGINCIDAVFNTTNINIDFDNLSFFLLYFCKLVIAFNPIGVATFPKS